MYPAFYFRTGKVKCRYILNSRIKLQFQGAGRRVTLQSQTQSIAYSWESGQKGTWLRLDNGELATLAEDLGFIHSMEQTSWHTTI